MATSARKKVLFTSHVANFQKFNRPFMRMLSEQGYEVHYASDGEEKILDCDKEFTIPFQRSPLSISNIKAIFQLKKIIDREGYDIIHTHTPMGSVVTRLAAIAARKKGTRVIYTAHGFHFFKGAPIANWLIYYPIEKVMARFTDILITINDEDYSLANRKFKIDARYVPGIGVDMERFKHRLDSRKRNQLRSTLGIKPSDFLIVYIAEIIPRKNHTMALRAMNIIGGTDKTVHLLLAGKDSMKGELQLYADRLGLSNNVHFLGYRTDVKDLCDASDLSISTSKQEGLGVGVMEALASGTPVVATDIRGHIRDVELIASNDHIGLANKILDVRNGTIKPMVNLHPMYDLNHVLFVHKGIYED